MRVFNFPAVGLRLAAAGVLLVCLALSAQAACLGVSRSVHVNKFSPHLGAGLSGGIGLRHKEVVLTFDDGPHAGTTNRVLAALRKECTKATFFVVGRMAKANPRLLKQVRRGGHTIAHHTYDHANLAGRSSAAVRRSITRGMRAVEATLGRGRASRMFRYPYLARTARTDKVVRSLGLLPLSAGIDSLDWKGGDFVGRTMRKLAKKGRGVILLHDLKQGTAKKLPSLLRRLREGGYKVVHLRSGGSRAPKAHHVAALDKSEKNKGWGRSRTAKTDRRRSKMTINKPKRASRRIRVAMMDRERGGTYRLRRSMTRHAKPARVTKAGTKRKLRKTAGKKRKSFLQHMRERHAARVKMRKARNGKPARRLARTTKKSRKSAQKRPSLFAQWRSRSKKRSASSKTVRRKTRIRSSREFALSLATLTPQADQKLLEAELAFLDADAVTDFDAVSELSAAMPGLDEASAIALLDDAQDILRMMD